MEFHSYQNLGLVLDWLIQLSELYPFRVRGSPNGFRCGFGGFGFGFSASIVDKDYICEFSSLDWSLWYWIPGSRLYI